MNDNNISTAPTVQQRKYLAYLAHAAHDAGLPFLPIDGLSRAQVRDWIEYLTAVVGAHERVEALLHKAECRVEEASASFPYLITPARDRLPASYRPAWQDLPDADDHEHLLGTIIRADGVEQSICALCGVSA
jgi:hypothetical protein